MSTMLEQPRTRYARCGDLSIAYQVLGDGPVDLVYVPGLISHLDWMWEHPMYARVLRRLSSFARLIWFDRRGIGLSDRTTDPAILEQRVEDVCAVMDAAGSTRAALLGSDEGGSIAAFFAATYPERVTALVMVGTMARRVRADDYPWGYTVEEADFGAQMITEHWGTPVFLDLVAPSVARDPITRRWWATLTRVAASPATAAANFRLTVGTDLRNMLPAIGVPTLVVAHAGDHVVDPEAAHDLASRVQGARYVEVPGQDHMFEIGEPEPVLAEIEHFVIGRRSHRNSDRVFTTALFTDIVDSTRRAAELGDGRWRELLDRHDALAARVIDDFRGRLVQHTGDGLLARFDGPARAVQCARTIQHGMRGIGLDVRAGVHSGEVELRGHNIGGLTVHIAARVSGLAGAGELLVTRTVVDLIAGSGVSLVDRGVCILKGVPDEMELFAVEG
jgi:class 3 adenylate cyclase